MKNPSTPSAPSRWKIVFRVTIILIGVTLIGLALFSANETPASISETRGESTVFFEADRNQILFPFECVTLQWDVENIWGVYLEEGGVIGQDTREWCILRDGNKPTLRVIFPQDEVAEYTLTIGIMSVQFEFVLGMIFIVSGGLLLFPRPGLWIYHQLEIRHRFTTLLIYVWVTGILFIFWSVKGTPGADFIMNTAAEIQRFFSTLFTAPYQG